MTLVSIKYTPRFSAVLPGKIVIIAHGGYGGQNISQWTAFGSEQRFFKQGPVFGFGASPVTHGTLFQSLNNGVIDTANNETRHGCAS